MCSVEAAEITIWAEQVASRPNEYYHEDDGNRHARAGRNVGYAMGDD